MGRHPLDNPLWHMLNDTLFEYATGTDLAKRGDPTVFPCATLAEHSDAAFNDLAQLYQSGETHFMLEAQLPDEIAGFKLHGKFPVVQLVCQQRTPVPETDMKVVRLTVDDVPEIVQLIELTQPGPFMPRLVEMQRYLGIRQNGQLVAMAGERMKFNNYCEVSAVCTHPDWRGNGYARILTLKVADGIWDRRETPFLHARPDNTSAIRIYEKLHFVKQRDLTAAAVTRI